MWPCISLLALFRRVGGCRETPVKAVSLIMSVTERRRGALGWEGTQLGIILPST